MWAGGEAELRGRAARRLRALGLRPPGHHAPRRHSVIQNGGIFGVPLEHVQRQSIACCNGSLEVPTIVYEACKMLKSHLTVEGLFRKAGSQSRQKELKRFLDSGGKIDKNYHAVDVASILKHYLRSLPEPIIGNDMQELLIRCSLLPESSHSSAIQLALLLLPITHLHILHYIMEFLKFVSSKSDLNKMDTNNLAIVIAPTIMPPPNNCPPHRFDHHVKLVKFLIDNANIIGIVPVDISDEMEKEESQKKKKRRSGSLTRMFTGLRKMVTSSNKMPNIDLLSTPVMDKASKKRTQTELQGLSAKKRKEILDILPQSNFPSTPRNLMNKEHKKLRLSIGRKSKEKLIKDGIMNEKTAIIAKNYSKSCDNLDAVNTVFDNKSHIATEVMELNNKENDYVRIPKSEYEAIKNRVSAIENRLSQEFNAITVMDTSVDGTAQQVQTAYEKTLEEAAMFSSPGSDQLARRLSKELKIRHSEEHKIIRSPSARKIGVIRRRSRDNMTRLTRTQTWTVSSHSGVKPVSIINNNDQLGHPIGLKRGRPNTLNTGLTHPNILVSTSSLKGVLNDSNSLINESDDQPMCKLPKVRSCGNTSYTRRPSSFHGIRDVGKSTAVNNQQTNDAIDKIKWKNAAIFLRNEEALNNPLTGRASVAKLRSQMAGTVLAKARLFDGMTDSDTSLEKGINIKPAKQVSGFARKSRKQVPNDNQNSSNSLNEQTSPISDNKNLKKNYYKSPGYVSKRHKSRVVKTSPTKAKVDNNLNLSTQLKEVIYDVCTPLSEKISKPAINENVKVIKVKESLKVSLSSKSPRLVTNNKKPSNFKSISTVKVNTPVRNNNVTPRRQSPRLAGIKSKP